MLPFANVGQLPLAVGRNVGAVPPLVPPSVCVAAELPDAAFELDAEERAVPASGTVLAVDRLVLAEASPTAASRGAPASEVEADERLAVDVVLALPWPLPRSSDDELSLDAEGDPHAAIRSEAPARKTNFVIR